MSEIISLFSLKISSWASYLFSVVSLALTYVILLIVLYKWEDGGICVIAA